MPPFLHRLLAVLCSASLLAAEPIFASAPCSRFGEEAVTPPAPFSGSDSIDGPVRFRAIQSLPEGARPSTDVSALDEKSERQARWLAERDPLIAQAPPFRKPGNASEWILQIQREENYLAFEHRPVVVVMRALQLAGKLPASAPIDLRAGRLALFRQNFEE